MTDDPKREYHPDAVRVSSLHVNTYMSGVVHDKPGVVLNTIDGKVDVTIVGSYADLMALTFLIQRKVMEELTMDNDVKEVDIPDFGLDVMENPSREYGSTYWLEISEEHYLALDSLSQQWAKKALDD